MTGTAPRFSTVVLDVDSTLCGIEGIDWLAARGGDAVARAVALQTDSAMRGDLRLEEVYSARLELVRPRVSDVNELGRAYIDSLAPGAVDSVTAWRAAGIRIILVSSAIRSAIVPLARHLGLAPTDVHAVNVRFDSVGNYAGFDTTSPLATAVGKRETIAALALPRLILMVGDGSTDLAAQPSADAFAAFTGFVTRRTVTAAADYVASSFADLNAIVLGNTA